MSRWFNRNVAVLALFCCVGTGMHGADSVLVFPAEGSIARIFDSVAIEQRGTLHVPVGSRESISFSGTTYIVGSNELSFIDESSNEIRRVSLTRRLADAQPAMAHLAKLDRLLVALDGAVAVFEASTSTFVGEIETSRPVRGLLVNPKSGDAFAVERSEAFQIDLDRMVIADKGMRFGSALTSLPGSSFDWLGAGDGFYELGRMTPHQLGTTQRDAAGATAVVGRLYGGADRMIEIDASLESARVLGSTAYEFPLPLDSIDTASSERGDIVWVVADNPSRLVAIDASLGLIARERLLDFDASALAIVPGTSSGGNKAAGPQRVSQAFQLTRVSGDPTVIGGTEFNIVVDGPIGGLPMSVASSNAALILCSEPVLDGLTTITCSSGPVANTQVVTVTVFAGGVTLDFTVTVITPEAANGLSKFSGDGQTVVGGAGFSVVVESRENTFPRSNLGLSVTSFPTEPTVNCPGAISTNSQGRANITCGSGEVEVDTPVTVSVTDGFQTVVFRLTLRPQALEGSLSKVSADPVEVDAGARIDLTVSALDVDAPLVGLAVTVNIGDGILSCPQNLTTDLNGQATASCTAASVAADSVTTVMFSSSVGSVTYFVTVRATSGDGLFILQGNRQIVSVNSVVPQPFEVQASKDGAPQVGLRLVVIPTRPDLMTCPTQVFTDGLGIGRITCTTGFVTVPTLILFQVSDDEGRQLPSSIRMTITPNDVGAADGLSLLTSDTLTVTAGAVQTGTVRVRTLNIDGDPVAVSPVFYSSSSPGVTFAPAQVFSDANGEAGTTIGFGCRGAGEINVGRIVGTTDLTVNFSTVTGSLSTLRVLQGNGQSGGPGQRLDQEALVVQATDTCSNAISGQTVNWAVVPATAASLENIIVTTDADGRSSAIARLGNIAGPFTVTASIGSLIARFELNVINPGSRFALVSGDSQALPVGSTSAPLVVNVANELGAAVQGVDVGFAVTSGSATVSAGTISTNAQGEAAVTVQAGQALGPVVVEARFGTQIVIFELLVVGRVPEAPRTGFVNGASFRTGWTAGSLGTIFGSGLMEAIEGVELAPFVPGIGFPTTFRGVRVSVDGVRAPIFALANANNLEQINLQVPFEVAGNSTVSVVLNNNGASTTIDDVALFPVQPGIFQVFVGNQVFSAALDEDFVLISPDNPAKKGKVVQLFLTGLGPLLGDVGTNVLGPVPVLNTASPPTVEINGVQAQTFGGFYAPFLISLYQTNFLVSPDSPSGLQPLEVVIDGTTSPAAFLAIE